MLLGTHPHRQSSTNLAGRYTSSHNWKSITTLPQPQRASSRARLAMSAKPNESCSTEECPPTSKNKYPSLQSAPISVSNKIQLSTYGDHIGKNLKDLETFLEDPRLEGAINGLHLLPVYPSSGDGGFAPLTYKEIDPKMGTWEDIERLSKKYEVMMECMVNHISPASSEFQDFLQNGEKSKTADMWIYWDKFWPKGRPNEKDLELIRTRKPSEPCIEVTLNDGSKRKLWCTFGDQQIDINAFSKSGDKFVTESLISLCKKGARLVRLDAFGYMTKKLDTPCFFEEPEVWEFLEKVNQLTQDYGTRMLCEVHEDFKLNLALADKGYYVYDFALPLLVIHALMYKTSKNLKNWMKICPRRQITVLDTHDGMGIDDITGLAEVCDQEQVADACEHALGCGPNFKYHYKNGKYVGSPHQYNCTYYSGLKKNDQSYLLARAIQFFTPGMPMIYYNGLFAAENDFKLLEETGNGRDINRHYYSLEEAKDCLDKPLVKALLQLCRFRNSHPAFEGQIAVVENGEDEKILDVWWKNENHHARLVADMETRIFKIYQSAVDESGQIYPVEYDLSDEATWSVKKLTREKLDEMGLTKDPHEKYAVKRHFSEV